MNNTLIEILKNPLGSDERNKLRAYGIETIGIRRKGVLEEFQEFTGYKAFSAFWEKTYAKQPERSSGGVISNLDSIPSFITFHIKIDFSLFSFPDYQRLYKLMLSANEFTVQAFDPLAGVPIEQNMYFAPDSLPKFVTMARKYNGEKFVEILGVQDYTIELIGTNTEDG
jgi:hypothetical protein